MSVLIKGMEMPVFEHQSWDIRRGADGKWYMVDTNAETSDGAWHEIVPVPPHGRLIDADAPIKVWEVKLSDGDRCSFRNIETTVSTFLLSHLIGEVPHTIIPAEEE